METVLPYREKKSNNGIILNPPPEVAEGYRTGEGDMIGMRFFSKTEELRSFV
jgi:hypothetical protein